LDQANVEGATVLRSLGEWLALQNKWNEAGERFKALWRENQFDDWDNATLDSLRLGVTLAEIGDRAQFEQFRKMVIDRFGSTTNAVVAERTIKISLLLPSSEEDVKPLLPLAALAGSVFASTDEKNEDAVFQAAWGSVSLALIEYREGNYAESEKWARHCLSLSEEVLPRTATAHLLLAMDCEKLGRSQEAAAELATGREIIEKKFADTLDRGEGSRGFWFDWVFGRVLMREASRLIEAKG
jgi:hypothetical protein